MKKNKAEKKILQECEAMVIVDFYDTGITNKELKKIASYLKKYFRDEKKGKVGDKRIDNIDTGIWSEQTECLFVSICVKSICVYKTNLGENPECEIGVPYLADCLNKNDFIRAVNTALRLYNKNDISICGIPLDKAYQLWGSYLDWPTSTIPEEEELIALIS